MSALYSRDPRPTSSIFTAVFRRVFEFYSSLHYPSITKPHRPSRSDQTFPDKIGLFWQDRSFSQIRLPVNPPRSNSWHKTHSRKIAALHLKPQCAYAFACFGVFRWLGYFRCFDISIVLNIFFPAKYPSLSQAEKTYKTDAL